MGITLKGVQGFDYRGSTSNRMRFTSTNRLCGGPSLSSIGVGGHRARTFLLGHLAGVDLHPSGELF
jgi:hypothetical protein